MITAPRPSSSRHASSAELAGLRVRLAEAEETLQAIRTGEVDAVVTAGKEGIQVFTLEGAGHAYRLLIESMSEGALTLTDDKMIVYANQCFANMVRCPLGQVMGSSFRRFLSTEDQVTLHAVLKRARSSGSKIQVQLHAGDGSQMPVQISLRSTPRHGARPATISMVVTDLTEARRTEELLRAFTHRVVQVQENERGRLVLELHGHLTQLHCAMLFRSHALALKLSAHAGPLKRDAMQLREMAGKAANEVERISRHLRPSVLDQLGLVAALRGASTEFADRTGVSVKLDCGPLTARLPGDIELTLYRIFQEALKNVQKHARARQVAVRLAHEGAFVQLLIKDDGAGFDPHRSTARRKGNRGLGLQGMYERAIYLGGILKIRSACAAGTEIEVRIPDSLAFRKSPATLAPLLFRKEARALVAGTVEEVGRRQPGEAALGRARTELSVHAVDLEGLVAARTSELAATNRRLEASVGVIRKANQKHHTLRIESKIMEGKFRQLTRQIITAQEEERKQISRELHDGVVQTLVGINVELATLAKAAPAGNRAFHAKIARTQRLVGKSVDAVHLFARELRPAILDDLGLIPALHSHLKIVAARHKLKIHLHAFAGVEALDNARRTVLYRVAQEALANVVRHAEASVVTMTISAIPGAIRTELHDNGKSFPVAQTLSSKTNRRLGLLGMRERLEMVGGTLTIESASGRGTTVCAEIPFRPRGTA